MTGRLISVFSLSSAKLVPDPEHLNVEKLTTDVEHFA
jgi:hypothetical protein